MAKGYRSAEFETFLASHGVTLILPAHKSDRGRVTCPLPKPLRQLFESVNATLKSKVNLERHGGRTPDKGRARNHSHLRRLATAGTPKGGRQAQCERVRSSAGLQVVALARWHGRRPVLTSQGMNPPDRYRPIPEQLRFFLTVLTAICMVGVGSPGSVSVMLVSVALPAIELNRTPNHWVTRPLIVRFLPILSFVTVSGMKF